MARGISKILSDKYGITATLGKKTDCPYCGHKTFSIKRDDSLGKCFHPACGKYITSWSDQNDAGSRHQQILKEFYHRCHDSLINHPDESSRRANQYLTEERQIHPNVVAASMIGVVPEGFKLEELKDVNGNPLLVSHNSHQNTAEADQKGDEALDKLERRLYKLEGWLCFFYTDENHQITSVKFRKPYSREFRYYKPFDRAGVFGYTLFSEKPGIADDEMPLLVTEGEFNQLQIQSLCARLAERDGQEPQYIPACAVGGVENADWVTIGAIARKPVICYDNDISEAGFRLVENARGTLNVAAFTTPEPDSDLDEYILSFGDDTNAAWDGIKGLIQERRHYPRLFGPVAEAIYRIRQKHGRSDSRREFEIHNEVSQEIISDLGERSKFYWDMSGAYLFMEAEKSLIPIDRDYTEFALLMANYGINKTEAIYKYIAQELLTKARQDGAKTQIHRLAYYDSTTNRVYLYNNNNQIYRIASDDIRLVDNGIDGVLFLSDSASVPFTVTEITGPKGLFEDLILSKINFSGNALTHNERRTVLLIWFLSIFFESIMPTKPILAIIGEKGSGKTITLRKFGIILFGRNFNVMPLPNKPEDFDTALTNNLYLAIDNADSRCNWLEDRLATAATGGTVKKRLLYTTNQLAEIPIHCYLAITSRTPRFQRDDVADRLLIMEVERFSDLIAESELLEEVIRNRNELMGEIVTMIRDVLKALEKNADYKDSGGFRMADFGNFAMKIAKHGGFEEQMRGIFGKLMTAQSAFTLAADPVFDLLNIWLQAEGNRGREVTSGQLCKELGELAVRENIEFYFRDKTQAFAQRLKNMTANLGQFLEITKQPRGGHRTYYSFRPKSGSIEK